jgi:ethanolamine utilization microcompartment shell protein EutS
MSEYPHQLGADELSLLETLDHVLAEGLVIAGEITISVADIDLIFVGLNVLLGSVETIEDVLGQRVAGGRRAGLPSGEEERGEEERVEGE